VDGDSNCMDWRLILEFLVIVGALAMGARMGGVGLGLWGAVGLLVLVVVFDVAPANIPGEVLLIVLTVIMAASAMEVAGAFNMSHLGWNHLCGRALRWDPRAPAPIMPYMHRWSAR
jgi:anaerobic C4-dicarboxylate transporter